VAIKTIRAHHDFDATGVTVRLLARPGMLAQHMSRLYGKGFADAETGGGIAHESNSFRVRVKDACWLNGSTNSTLDYQFSWAGQAEPEPKTFGV